MTSVEAIEIALDECDRFRMRAERALTDLRNGLDRTQHTAAVKRASLDLTKALVHIRRTEPPAAVHFRPVIPMQEEVRRDIENTAAGTQPDPDQFLCSECGCLVDLHKMISPEITGDKVCESCFHSNAYQSRRKKEREQKPAAEEQKTTQAEQPEWISVRGVKDLRYRLLDDSVELRKDGVDCDKWSFDIIYTLLDLKGRSRSQEISSLTRGQTWYQKKSIALNQLVGAVEDKTVRLPGGDE